MKYNVGGADRIIRMTLGIVLLCLAFFHFVTGGWAIAAYVFGALATLTGVFRFCPAWPLLGINTHHPRQV